MVDDIAVQEFVDAISTPPQNIITTYSGVVSRIDNQGVVWVRLAGANNETPTASTSAEVESGDEVTVEWRNNKLYIGGNYSNPSAGTIRVDAVQQAAQVANQAAANAVADAGVARSAAQQAQATAEAVEGIAVRAEQSATDAQASADSARSSANTALDQLGIIENVVGVLNLLQKNGDYELTEDTEVQPNKWYFTQDGYAGGSYSGSIATFETTAGDNIESLVADIEPIQSGSGDPSPSNVRPISGRTEVVTQRTGKNLLPTPYNDGASKILSGITFTVNSDGSVHVSGTNTSGGTVSFYLRGGTGWTLPVGDYTLTGTPSGGGASTYFMSLYYGNNGSNHWGRFDFGSGQTYTLTDDTNDNLGCRIGVARGVTVDATFYPMLRLATDTDATYEPYKGTTYTTALGRTVYGGTLDVVSGVLTVDRAMVTLNGSETWTASNGTATACMRVQTSTNVGFKPNTSNASLVGDISSAFVEVTPNQTRDGTIGFSVSTDANPYLHFCQTGQKNMSVEAWKTYLASNPIQVVYKLATPQTYQLTPRQVATLLSVNNLWASSGNVSVTVRSTYSYSVVNNPTGDPHAQGWYELIGIDEAVTNYVSSHLALTDDGLSLQQNGSDYRILISTDGLKIIGANGATVASYGTETTIGSVTGFNVKITGTELGFYQGTQRVAYINNNQLYITQSVVLQQMDLGTPVASGGLGQWSWKVHPNGQNPSRNNLNLKWIG